jgi:recombination protein RecT
LSNTGTNALKAAATGKAPANPLVAFSSFMDKFKPQLALALPKHLTADRMARLALTAFSTTPALQKCSPMSIAASVMTAGQLGLEIGVNGQGFLVPYGTTCTFVPGWKGLQDLANRSGRATSWTGAVFEGDEFDYRLGDSPFVHHRPGDETDPEAMTHVYAVGRVNGSNWPIVEVWTVGKVRKHRDKYNKVGNRHYSFRDWEMYARKVPLLQALKYLPSSVELSNALAVANAAEVGQRADILDGCVTVGDIDLDGDMNAAAFIERIEGAADRASAEAILQQALAYGLDAADAAQVEKAFAKKWPATAQG